MQSCCRVLTYSWETQIKYKALKGLKTLVNKSVKHFYLLSFFAGPIYAFKCLSEPFPPQTQPAVTVRTFPPATLLSLSNWTSVENFYSRHYVVHNLFHLTNFVVTTNSWRCDATFIVKPKWSKSARLKLKTLFWKRFSHIPMLKGSQADFHLHHLVCS